MVEERGSAGAGAFSWSSGRGSRCAEPSRVAPSARSARGPLRTAHTRLLRRGRTRAVSGSNFPSPGQALQQYAAAGGERARPRRRPDARASACRTRKVDRPHGEARRAVPTVSCRSVLLRRICSSCLHTSASSRRSSPRYLEFFILSRPALSSCKARSSCTSRRFVLLSVSLAANVASAAWADLFSPVPATTCQTPIPIKAHSFYPLSEQRAAYLLPRRC